MKYIVSKNINNILFFTLNREWKLIVNEKKITAINLDCDVSYLYPSTEPIDPAGMFEGFYLNKSENGCIIHL